MMALLLRARLTLISLITASLLLTAAVGSQAQPVTTEAPSLLVLPYITLGTTEGVEREYVGHYDDGVSHAIHIPSGFPFGNVIHSFVYIGTNGILSFSEPFYSTSSTFFPSSSSSIAQSFIVAPFWSDVDLRKAGNISYEVHSTLTNNSETNRLLSDVSQFVEQKMGQAFNGSWMLVAEWRNVHSWPHGSEPEHWYLSDLTLTNTWQVLVITNGRRSYTVFTYRCGDMNWSGYSSATSIGFNAGGEYFVNDPNTGSYFAHEIACRNAPISEWYNLVYEISLPNVTNETADLPTIESPQSEYLPFLEVTNLTATSGTLPPCQNCTAAISIPSIGFPFGSYYHYTLYVGTNGIFSFDHDFRQDLPKLFPSTDIEVYTSYLVAPYWSNIDTRLDGRVKYEVHVEGENWMSDNYLRNVSSFISAEQETDFNGNWMIVATWDKVHPFPHGNSAQQDRIDPYLQSVNTFQGILITNGTNSYAVFTYECDLLEWSDEAVIGYNAAGDFTESHPLTGTLLANAIDCVHINDGIRLNNIIYDLVPEPLTESTPPPPPTSLGSCVSAGYSDCCVDGSCLGEISDCYCDKFCYNLNDCCSDISSTCSTEAPNGNDTYIILGSTQFLSRVNVMGNDQNVLVHQPNSSVLAVDFDYRRGYLFWHDGITNTIYRSAMDGSNIEPVTIAGQGTVYDIAMDWIGNNLYWTNPYYSRIEVINVDSRLHTIVLNTDSDSFPKGIAVDPSSRLMYWTDGGTTARIEQASMDGSDRRVLHNTGLLSPSTLTVDYLSHRIYWIDGSNTIEYSNLDGTGRFSLTHSTGGSNSLGHITLDGDLVLWTSHHFRSIHVTHKDFITSVNSVYTHSRDVIYGIEAVSPNRQNQNIYNSCEEVSCEHLCLLSSTATEGYSCKCQHGYELGSDGNCTFVGTPPPPTVLGSCKAAGHQTCCPQYFGNCTGNPPNCACDEYCYYRGDCCPDIRSTCIIGSCAAAGYRACCTDEDNCRSSRGCYCDDICHFWGDCCHDYVSICPVSSYASIGSCSAAGYTTCCDDGSDCYGSPANCKCDRDCREHGDCCSDVHVTCPNIPASYNHTVQTVWLPYLPLQTTPGVTASSTVTSSAIPILTGFPIGNSNQTVAYVNSNGVISFQQSFFHSTPHLFPSEFTYISSAYILAPFWSDLVTHIDSSILYEVHQDPDSSLLLQVNEFISNYTETTFNGTWMLLVQWNNLLHTSDYYDYYDNYDYYPESDMDDFNTFQAIAITDGSQSYAVYTYKCGDIGGWSGEVTIGYNAGPVGNFYANHPLSGENSHIACINGDKSEWSNVVYNVSIDVYIPTEAPPVIEHPQSTYLSFLERTNNSLTMPSCDDCVSNAIDLNSHPIPFGDTFHSIAHVSTNGIISFGDVFPYYGATLLPNEDDSDIFNSYLVAPYWSDIDNRELGEIWYETHSTRQNPNSDSLLERVSVLVRSEQNLISFQGTWMIVATWNGSVPYAGTGSVRNTFQGIVITDGFKTYAVYTYHCNDVEWSDGSVIGFNAGGTYYANHPLSDSFSARDIDCVHLTESEWNNVVYDVNPNNPPEPGDWLPFLSLSTTPGITTSSVSTVDDGSSPQIFIPTGFPFGNSILHHAFVGTNGIISFQQPFLHHAPYLFPSEYTYISSAFVLAPFWSDVNIINGGSIEYEIHSGSNDNFISQVNRFLSNSTGTVGEFEGTWLLVAQWNQVAPFGGAMLGSVNTYQAIAITDGSQSYAVYTYKCGELEWSGGATIGYNAGPVGNFYANHPLSGGNAISIACVNIDETEWSNVVYNVSNEEYTPTEVDDIEQPQSIYLDFISRSSNAQTMLRCDDCVSSAITFVTTPVPFGDIYHTVAHISTNGVISFGDVFPHHGATLLPNEDNLVVFNSYLAAPYWSDIDNRELGEIWYETHSIGQNSNSNSLLEQVSVLVRSEQNLISFQGTWMIVATWNGSVPYAGTGTETNTFQGIVITDGFKTYAVYTYHCDDIEWSDGSVIGFNAGGSYYANHPLSDSFSARDIDCVHSTESEWNNVVYDVNPNTTPPEPAQPTTRPTTAPPTTRPTTAPPTTRPATPPPTTQPTTAPPTTQPTMSPPTTRPTTATLVPGPVQKLSAISPNGSDTMLITKWSAPANSIGEIFRYYVLVTNYSLDTVANISVPGDITTTLVTGLGPFIPYIVTVLASNTLVNGTKSSVVNFTRQGEPQVSPSNVNVKKIESGRKMEVTWDLLTPEEAFGFILTYTVSYQKEGASRKRQIMQKTVPGTQNNVVIEDIDPNADYDVTVWGSTSAGAGKHSEPTSTKVSVARHGGNKGGTIAGGLIAVIVVVIVVATIIVLIVAIIRRNHQKRERFLKSFGDVDTASIVSGAEENWYRHKKTGRSTAKSAVYNTMADAPTYENPLYESNLTSESFALPGKTKADCTKLEIKELTLENPYEAI